MGDQSLHKLMFSGPPFWAQKGPRAFGAPDPDLGLQKWGLGSKISKLGNQQPCRIHSQCPKRGHMLQVMAPTMSGLGPKFGVENWFKSGGKTGSNLRPWTLPNCGRGLQNQDFRIFGKSGKFGPQVASIWGAMGSKMASIWRLRSQVKSRAVARSLQEASGSPG